MKNFERFEHVNHSFHIDCWIGVNITRWKSDVLELSDPFKICARCIFKLPRQRPALNEFISLLSGYRNRVPIQSESFHFSIGIASFFQEIPLCFVQSLSTLSYFHHSILRYLFPSLSLLLLSFLRCFSPFLKKITRSPTFQEILFPLAIAHYSPHERTTFRLFLPSTSIFSDYLIRIDRKRCYP